MEGLLWLLGFGVLFYVMMRYGCGAHMIHGSHHAQPHGDGGDKDPVCGMTVAADSGYIKFHHGARYAFCSKDCLEKFDAEPARYLPNATLGRTT